MAWPRVRPLGLQHRDTRKSFPGYTLYSGVRAYHADLIDHRGRIVHQWHHPEGIQHVKLLANGNLLVHLQPPEDGGAEGAEHIGGSARGVVELDARSNVVWEHRDPYLHHDYQRLANGNTLLVRWDKLPMDVAVRVPGGFVADDDPEWMWGDAIREVDRNGNVVSEWRSWEHLAPEHHAKCPLESRKEWGHLNSLELTPDGRWLVSFRVTDTIVLVDPKSGAVRWRWGPGQVSHQHHATWLDDGKILLFDNGCHRREWPSFSRVIEVDPKTRAIGWTYVAPSILGFFSFMVSGCERQPNGNTLITDGASGHIFEVTKEGETVWEYVSPWLLPSSFGDTWAVFRAYRISQEDPRLAGLPLSPAPYARLERKIAANKPLGAADEPGYRSRQAAARRAGAAGKKTAKARTAKKGPKKQTARRSR